MANCQPWNNQNMSYDGINNMGGFDPNMNQGFNNNFQQQRHMSHNNFQMNGANNFMQNPYQTQPMGGNNYMMGGGPGPMGGGPGPMGGYMGGPNQMNNGFGRDPDCWSPPKPKVQKKQSMPNAVNNKNVNNKRKDYDKPWLNGVKPKTANNDKKGKGERSKDPNSFLNFHYPDGVGPDTDLVKMLEKEVVDKAPNICFDDIAELERAKEILMETVILPMKMPKFYQGIRKPRKGVLLFGPPGTGKTMLAKALAKSSDTVFFSVNPSTLASKWKGDSEKLVR